MCTFSTSNIEYGLAAILPGCWAGLLGRARPSLARNKTVHQVIDDVFCIRTITDDLGQSTLTQDGSALSLRVCAELMAAQTRIPNRPAFERCSLTRETQVQQGSRQKGPAS